MNLLDLLPRDERVAIRQADGRTLTFRALRESGDAVAGGLRKELAAGERILLMQPVCITLYQMLTGLFRAEVPAVVVDPAAGLRRMRASLERVGVRGVFGPWQAQLLRLAVPGLAFNVSAGWVPFTRRLAHLHGDAPPQAGDPDRHALLTFTTGSTGRPKAVARSHRLLDAQRRALHAHMDLGPDDVDLATLPIFALASLAAGAQVVFADCDLRRPGSVDPARALAQLRGCRVTTATASPAFFAPLAAWMAARGERYDGLRALWTGGARVPARLLATLCEVFPNARVEVLYGSTEAEPIAGVDARACLAEIDAGEEEGRGALVGRPVLDVRVDAGEILVSGAHVNPSYFEDPEADAATKVHDGDRLWHRTGDTGYLDATGRLWLTGRVADVVCGLQPFPVEAAAERVPGVRRAALIERAGEPLLCVEGGDAAAVRARTGVIHVLNVSRVPVDRRHNAKVDRAALRALVG